jgi:hypothetical protein
VRTAWARFCATALIGIGAGLFAAPVWADLYSAELAYQKKDFPKAFEEFKELAELGQPRAQYDLAAMYARGEGAQMSFTYAHAWASLAAANGEAAATALAATLAPQLTATSLKISADIQAQFGQAALDARLLPHVLQGREYEDRDPVRASKPYIPSYPSLARSKRDTGRSLRRVHGGARRSSANTTHLICSSAGIFRSVRQRERDALDLLARENPRASSRRHSKYFL